MIAGIRRFTIFSQRKREKNKGFKRVKTLLDKFDLRFNDKGLLFRAYKKKRGRLVLPQLVQIRDTFLSFSPAPQKSFTEKSRRRGVGRPEELSFSS
jgi:hypothetical protein